jgi:hypothetical protein
MNNEMCLISSFQAHIDNDVYAAFGSRDFKIISRAIPDEEAFQFTYFGPFNITRPSRPCSLHIICIHLRMNPDFSLSHH